MQDLSGVNLLWIRDALGSHCSLTLKWIYTFRTEIVPKGRTYFSFFNTMVLPNQPPRPKEQGLVECMTGSFVFSFVYFFFKWILH